jgi:hypothetical protein
MLIPFRWARHGGPWKPPGKAELVHRYRWKYKDLRIAPEPLVLQEALIRTAPGVSARDRWCVWVYLEDHQIPWTTQYKKIANQEYYKEVTYEKRKRGI